MSNRQTGTVKWFSEAEGCGFIRCMNGSDVLVHPRALVSSGLQTLCEGQRVSFDLIQGQEGLQAENVSVA